MHPHHVGHVWRRLERGRVVRTELDRDELQHEQRGVRWQRQLLGGANASTLTPPAPTLTLITPTVPAVPTVAAVAAVAAIIPAVAAHAAVPGPLLLLHEWAEWSLLRCLRRRIPQIRMDGTQRLQRDLRLLSDVLRVVASKRWHLQRRRRRLPAIAPAIAPTAIAAAIAPAVAYAAITAAIASGPAIGAAIAAAIAASTHRAAGVLSGQRERRRLCP